MRQSEIDRPLSSLELKRLKAFMRSCPDSMGFHRALGFLTGICSTPNMFMPSQWMPMLMGPVKYDSEVEAQEINHLIIRLYNQINESLNADALKQPPASLKGEQVEDWCNGYLDVSQMDETWGNDERALGDLFPLCVLVGMFDSEEKLVHEGRNVEDNGAQRNLYRESLPQVVSSIHNYWKRWRRDQMTFSAPAPKPVQAAKIQRNDPCPCRSGLKYKKCCGH